MTKDEKKKFKEVEKAFQKIQYLFSGIRWGAYGNQYFSICLKEEKEHLRGCPANICPGLTAQQGAKYFYVKYLIDFLYSFEKLPTIKEILFLRPSYVFSATLAENYPDEIRKALEGVNIAIIKALDYAELAKDDAEKLATV